MCPLKERKHDFIVPFHLKTKSPTFKKALAYCDKVACSNANILLSGESGTGKEVLARYIHQQSLRKSGSFVPINPSSFSESLLESELFGHVQGAFTGASNTRKGKFEHADKGTFFLDEVGDINTMTQLKLLRVLESKSIERIGSNNSIHVDFRLISATHQDLKELVSSSLFREDFFYRISTVVIKIPPLRERPEDLSDLIDFFIRHSEKENSTKIRRIAPEVMRFLKEYDYPGNIRELKNIIERMVILSVDGTITSDGLPIMYDFKRKPFDTATSSNNMPDIILPLKDFKRQSERGYIKWVLKQTGGNVAAASRKLQISTRHLFNKINELEVNNK